MILVKENDVYKRERAVQFTNRETITFKHPEQKVYQKHESDWYMQIALEKSDLVKEDRHLLTYDLLVSYRCAIREGFNHELDKTLTKPYSFPRNHNTINGIKGYIERIEKASQAQMEAVMNTLDKPTQFEQLDKMAEKAVQKQGWYAHCVYDDPYCPHGVNYHTHGLAETFDHPDLQICFPLDPTELHSLMAVVIDRVKKGEQFKPGVVYLDILDNDYKVQFIQVAECGRQILRLILPDANNCYDDPEYAAQFTKTIHVESGN